MTTAISVQDLGKSYKRYTRPVHRIYEWLGFRRGAYTRTWPVRGVSFSVDAGEAVGIIGQNGAGKTTLMNLIRGLIFPTTGSIHIDGSLSALDLGLGFHPDFTGRENLVAAGALLGLMPHAVKERTAEIQDFAEIGDYLDRPVRTYSTGMQMRLAFSLATTIRPQIFAVDEALAVGDAYFQQKCIRRMREYLEAGTTLLLVSHDQAAIKTLCSRVLMLDEGLLVRDGRPQEVLEYYNGVIARSASEYSIRQGSDLGGTQGTTRHGTAEAVVDEIQIAEGGTVASAFRVGATVTVDVRGHVQEDLDELTVGILLRDRLGNEIFGTNTHHLGTPVRSVEKGSAFVATFEFPLNLGVGVYSVTVSLHAGAAHVHGNYDWWDGVESIRVLPGSEPAFSGSCYIPVSVDFSVPAAEKTIAEFTGPGSPGSPQRKDRGSS